VIHQTSDKKLDLDEKPRILAFCGKEVLEVNMGGQA